MQPNPKHFIQHYPPHRYDNDHIDEYLKMNNGLQKEKFVLQMLSDDMFL